MHTQHGRIAYWSLATFSESSGYNTWQLRTALDVAQQLTAQCKTALNPTVSVTKRVEAAAGGAGGNNKKIENNDPTSSEEVGEGMMTACPPHISSVYLKIVSIRQSAPPQSPYT